MAAAPPSSYSPGAHCVDVADGDAVRPAAAGADGTAPGATAAELTRGLEALCRLAALTFKVTHAVVWQAGAVLAGAVLAGTAPSEDALARAADWALAHRDTARAGGGAEGCVAALPLPGDGPQPRLLMLMDPAPRVLTAEECAQLADLAAGAASLLALGAAAQEAMAHMALFRLLAENSTDTIVRGDLNGVRRYVSPACRELLGYEPEELVGRRAVEIVHPDDMPAFARMMNELREGRVNAARSEQRQRHKDGHWVWIEAFIRRTRDPQTGLPDGYVVSVRNISRRKAAEQRLAHLAAHDALTGLANRTLLQDRLEAEMARARRTGAGLAVLCLDLDRFKRVNDSLGHEAGDAVLRTVAERLKQATRGEDLVARVGGDEFVVVQAAEVDPQAGADALAARLISLVSTPMDFRGETVSVGLSVGVAAASAAEVARGLSLGGLLRAGDLALYAAKAAGRGRAMLADLSQIEVDAAAGGR
ncbi:MULTISPECIES: diguanylate cyclase [unclassified Xanthobacter]|uniref:diguanylate cyclase n=1 Tax=unclassified Xanthobacter TaxID=2623496 RepID=UPI001EDE4675|nr:MULTISPECIES: diguanylate cyclase [unclassified Xanthobacter]